MGSIRIPYPADQFKRFRNDFQKRYSGNVGSPAPRPVDKPATRPAQTQAAVRLRKLPPEIGILLTIIGIAGLLLPGPVGSPFLVAGGIALWPAGFRKVEKWFMKAAPGLYETGIHQIEVFLVDLERRYPGSLR
jgi:hypothetical protein